VTVLAAPPHDTTTARGELVGAGVVVAGRVPLGGEVGMEDGQVPGGGGELSGAVGAADPSGQRKG